MIVKLLKYPTDEDWALAKQCALVTIGKETVPEPRVAWNPATLRARHSPLRTLPFAFCLEGVPYWVSTHLARHVHAQPFIRSQRNDRQDAYDRNAARQDAPVDMIWYMNAEELMAIAEKRICKLAAKETREAVLMMRWLVVNHCPEFEGLLEPHCTKYGDCPEMKPCETGRRLQGGNDTGD